MHKKLRVCLSIIIPSIALANAAPSRAESFYRCIVSDITGLGHPYSKGQNVEYQYFQFQIMDARWSKIKVINLKGDSPNLACTQPIYAPDTVICTGITPYGYSPLFAGGIPLSVEFTPKKRAAVLIVGNENGSIRITADCN